MNLETEKIELSMAMHTSIIMGTIMTSSGETGWGIFMSLIAIMIYFKRYHCRSRRHENNLDAD